MLKRKKKIHELLKECLNAQRQQIELLSELKEVYWKISDCSVALKLLNLYELLVNDDIDKNIIKELENIMELMEIEIIDCSKEKQFDSKKHETRGILSENNLFIQSVFSYGCIYRGKILKKAYVKVSKRGEN